MLIPHMNKVGEVSDHYLGRIETIMYALNTVLTDADILYKHQQKTQFFTDKYNGKEPAIIWAV